MTVTSQNVDKPKRRQTETSTNRNVDKRKRRQTETSTNQKVDKPKRRQTKTSTDHGLSRDWATVVCDKAHSYPVIRRSKFLVSPAYHTWLATSAQYLMLLAVLRNKALCQAPSPWYYNTIPWWRHIWNSFRNLELDTLIDVKTTGKDWLNFILLTSRDKKQNRIIVTGEI